ncbi:MULTISPECIES: hypothetical protein [Pseudomonas]|uniref:Uncharacterized protein n=1 Tax=Pseudomonas koreensis TaxID=198620 RepID=A0A9X3BBL3_9PSED|nr:MULTISPECIES: hypothetical protein [Pseudomonas]MBV4477547.1 hypothetical protein [Pseudomonas botevensis]MCU7248179.1 hypothetical protein [Pseudomonas koreensis]
MYLDERENVELEKLQTETRKLAAERCKLLAERAKLKRETAFYPLVAGAGVLAACATAYGLFLKL